MSAQANRRQASVFRRLAIIGCGLLGSSLARAARRGRAAGQIAAFDKSPQVRERVRALGFADHVAETAAEAVVGADLVVLAVPVGAIGDVTAEIAEHLEQSAVLSDVGSVKEAVVDAAAPHLAARAGEVHFIPAHPVAGTEQSGPDAGFATLFDGKWCILTPLDGADPAKVDQLAAFWRALGAEIETMTAERHDRVLAITSHLPHLIAYTIVGTASDLETVDEADVMKYSAGGFRDFTRIAASDPVMWRDVFLTNRPAVLELLGRFTEDLIALQRAIRWSDGAALQAHFTRTQAVRKGILALGQDVDRPDFGRGGRPEREPNDGD